MEVWKGFESTITLLDLDGYSFVTSTFEQTIKCSFMSVLDEIYFL
jgi:hypothetical protein